MSDADRLMLDAKQAILDEQHRRFQVLQQEGRWPEAMQQFQVTLGCASDLLNESVALLQRLVENRRPAERPSSSPPAD
ncbi:MAG TPA: hypothetical protein VHF07_08310 [Nitrospiraceae bacterium]|nr:hypothetical protein [Nitrospiraceae bacterium]